jgi:16S rRNA (cytidine1402-2'-O)-methyltransferase
MSGTLYLVPVALGDSAWEAVLPPRTREIACSLDCFVVENAKTARAQLRRAGYPKPLQQVDMRTLPQAGESGALADLLAPLLDGRSAGLMSEAGCPGIADPGAALVRLAHEHGVKVVPLVGPSSILLALMASGLEGQRFAFHGYLPVREEERRQAIRTLESASRRLAQTQIFIETPYRNLALLASLLAACAPTTLLCLASDLTGVSETVTTRSVAQWRQSAAPPLERVPTVFLLLAA